MSETQVHIIGQTEPDKCEMCGVVDELRPYGPKGENVCFECGMKDEEAMKRQFELRMTQSAISVEQFIDVLNGKTNS